MTQKDPRAEGGDQRFDEAPTDPNRPAPLARPPAITLELSPPPPAVPGEDPWFGQPPPAPAFSPKGFGASPTTDPAKAFDAKADEGKTPLPAPLPFGGGPDEDSQVVRLAELEEEARKRGIPIRTTRVGSARIPEGHDFDMAPLTQPGAPSEEVGPSGTARHGPAFEPTVAVTPSTGVPATTAAPPPLPPDVRRAPVPLSDLRAGRVTVTRTGRVVRAQARQEVASTPAERQFFADGDDMGRRRRRTDNPEEGPIPRRSIRTEEVQPIPPPPKTGGGPPESPPPPRKHSGVFAVVMSFIALIMVGVVTFLMLTRKSEDYTYDPAKAMQVCMAGSEWRSLEEAQRFCSLTTWGK